MTHNADWWADWLVDAVAAATKDRRYLLGEPEEDVVAIEAIHRNGHKAILGYSADAHESDQALIGDLCDALTNVSTIRQFGNSDMVRVLKVVEIAKAALAVAKQREEKKL